MNQGDEHKFNVYVVEPKPRRVEIEVEEIPPRREPPLCTPCDSLDRKLLLEGGKEVLQRLRDLALGVDVPVPDTTFEEKDPFAGEPIRRTQLPVYQEDTERYRSAHASPIDEEPTPCFVTPRLVGDAVLDVMEKIPSCEEVTLQVTQQLDRAKAWLQDLVCCSSPESSKKNEDPKDQSQN